MGPVITARKSATSREGWGRRRCFFGRFSGLSSSLLCLICCSPSVVSGNNSAGFIASLLVSSLFMPWVSLSTLLCLLAPHRYTTIEMASACALPTQPNEEEISREAGHL